MGLFLGSNIIYIILTALIVAFSVLIVGDYTAKTTYEMMLNDVEENTLINNIITSDCYTSASNGVVVREYFENLQLEHCFKYTNRKIKLTLWIGEVNEGNGGDGGDGEDGGDGGDGEEIYVSNDEEFKKVGSGYIKEVWEIEQVYVRVLDKGEIKPGLLTVYIGGEKDGTA